LHQIEATPLEMIQRGPAAQEAPNAGSAEAARAPKRDLRVLPPRPPQALKPKRVRVLAKELAQVQKASVPVWAMAQSAPFAADSRAWGQSAALLAENKKGREQTSTALPALRRAAEAAVR
jgi:hypothetical protein